jgi:thymidylate synthase
MPTEVRGLQTMEILSHQTEVDMSYPIVTLKARKLGYKFMCAEAWWILTGQNTVETIKPYSKEIERFSDDGVYYNGAYGPRIVDQLTYAVDCLAKDPSSRQAIIEIWRPNPRDSKDVPCTIAVQFLIRDNHLYCIDTMRSSDLWLGWPYDIFNFTMLSARILELLAKRSVEFKKTRLGFYNFKRWIATSL